MPIVDARAIPYDQMVNFASGKGVSLHASNTPESAVQPHDAVAIISITDSQLPKLFNDSDKVCTLEFADIEPMNIEFIPPPDSEYMTVDHAKKVVEFIENIHLIPEKTLVLVNCRHGMCRSGAVVDFIGMTCGLGYWNTRKRNPQIVPNHWVQYLLLQEHFVRRLSHHG